MHDKGIAMNDPAASGGVSQRTSIMDATSGGAPSARQCRVKSPVGIVFSLLFGVGIGLLARQRFTHTHTAWKQFERSIDA
jgi:uncharacterized membrane protein YeiB